MERFIVAGGGGNAATLPAEIYNAALDTWTELPYLGLAFPHAFSWVHNGHTFFMGGGYASSDKIFYLSLRGLEDGGELKQTEWKQYPEVISADMQDFGSLSLIP